MKVRHSVAAAVLIVVCAASVAHAQGNQNGSGMQNTQSGSGMQNTQSGGVTNNSGRSDAADTNRRLENPTGTSATGSGATNTNSGRATPDEQDTSRGKGPSTATPPVGSR